MTRSPFRGPRAAEQEPPAVQLARAVAELDDARADVDNLRSLVARREAGAASLATAEWTHEQCLRRVRAPQAARRLQRTTGRRMSTKREGEPMTNDPGRLELNARAYRYDARMEQVCDLFDRDPDAWLRLHVVVQDQSGIYRDLRDHYRRAVAAGVIPDDRGPTRTET